MAYLDHNATSPLRPEARNAMRRACEAQANASSVHRFGRAARELIENARDDVAEMVGARPAEVIFTSGGTEANALALWSAVEGDDSGVERLLVSAIEHDSILNTATDIARHRSRIVVTEIPVTDGGMVSIEALDRLLENGGSHSLIAVMAANNETGVVQPIGDVIKLAREAKCLVLVDAVQACGKLEIDFTALGADYLTLSAHKLGGPHGAGALVVNENTPFAPQIRGGGQERNRRAGTENVAGIAGFGAAAGATRADDVSRPPNLRDLFEGGLKSRFSGVTIFGESAPRLVNTSNFAIAGLSAETAVIALDLDGVMVSSGSACSSGKVRPSHVLKAMGVPAPLAGSALRVSLGWNSTEEDIERALGSLEKLVARASTRRAA